MIYLNIGQKQDNLRLDQAATILYQDFSRNQIQKWIQQGNLLVNGESLKSKDKVHFGDELSLDPVFDNKVSWDGENIALDIIHESSDFLIINKPSGLVMHPGAGCHDGTLANALAFHFPFLKDLPRCGIVHRLDKDTSGILVVAKNEKFRNFFVDRLQDREIYKEYQALVVGQIIGSFSIDHPIGRDPKNRVKMRVTDSGREALSHVSLLKNYGGYSHISIAIETGRTHQIRVHLSNQKFPIIGDALYNPRNLIAKDTPKTLITHIQSFPRQALHATKISFPSLKGKTFIEFQAKLPKDIKSLIKEMKSALEPIK